MESTLALSYEKLRRDIGLFLGYGPGELYSGRAWEDAELRDIASAIESGLRQFYSPPRLEGESCAHTWSFLSPVTTLRFSSGAEVLELPDDFGSINQRMNLTASANSGPIVVDLVNDGQIRLLYAADNAATGAPCYAAIRPLRGTTADDGQRSEMHIYPLADQDYDIEVPYNILPDMISTTRPFPYGGADHSECILASCKAAAEANQDDAKGLWWVNFMERLAASIDKDRQKYPMKLGYNGDRSAQKISLRESVKWGSSVTVNGIQY